MVANALIVINGCVSGESMEMIECSVIAKQSNLNVVNDMSLSTALNFQIILSHIPNYSLTNIYKHINYFFYL